MSADGPPTSARHIEEEIAGLRREISRLGVLLGNRHISPEGYAFVVKGLK